MACTSLECRSSRSVARSRWHGDGGRHACRSTDVRVAELMRAREEVTGQGMKIAIVESGVNRLWVLERLRENVERSMQAKPVLDKEGQPTGEYRYEAAAANRALE